MTAADTMTALKAADQDAADGPAAVPTPTIGPRHARQSSVNKRLTPKRRKARVENDEYAKFARRILRSYAARVAAGDIEALTMLAGLSDEIDLVIQASVSGLREHGYSWADIGARLNVSRQAAQQRWGTRA